MGVTHDGNWEGKETRFGVANSALWAVATTAASNGSVNAMHDSFTPLGGLVPMVTFNLPVIRTAIVGVLAIGLTLVAGRDLTAATFQRDLAVADGHRVRTLDLVLMVLLAATVAVAVRAVGSLLVASLLLVPSAAARLVTRRIVTMHLAGIGFAAVEGVVGLWLAYQLDAPPGAGIAVVSSAVFVNVAAFRRLWAWRSRQLAVIPI